MLKFEFPFRNLKKRVSFGKIGKDLIKLVVMDADGTIWNHHSVSELVSPFRLISRDIAEDRYGDKVVLKERLRDFLEFAKHKGILVSLASWNEPENVFELLSVFKISDYLVYPMAEPHPNKNLMIKRILVNLEMKGIKVHPEEVLYIDDRDIHLMEVRESIGNVNFLKFGYDVGSWQDVINKLSLMINEK
jgi:magnesium-dependent phosphatase-1